MLLSCNNCIATLADEQFFFLIFYIICPVKYCQIKDLIRELYPLSGYAMLLALTTKDTFSVISFDCSYTFFPVIRKCYCLTRTDICTGFTTDSVFIVDYRLPSEVLKRDMRFRRKLRSKGRCYE